MRVPNRFAISIRYARFLLWEFRWPLIVFWSLVLVSGFVLQRFYHHDDPVEMTYTEACYNVFLLIFMETADMPFPDEWYLQPLFFLLPIIGLGAVADSVIRLAYLVFTRKQHLPEWQQMVASLYRKHVVVVGVGKVGYQIVKGILALREPVVVIERPATESSLLEEIIDAGVPAIRGDGRTVKTLEQANVKQARAVILATSDDLTNLDAGLTARDLNPTAKIVMRLFDESLAKKVSGAFAMPTISTSQVSAPAFIAAATGRKVYQDFQLAGKHVYLTDLTICPTGRLVGRSVGEIQADTHVNIVMHQTDSSVNVNPDHSVVLAPNDVVLVIAPIDRLNEMEALNQPVPSPEDGQPARIVQTNPTASTSVDRSCDSERDRHG